MKIIVGLGNPGKEYEKTRHNAGFMAIDALAEKYGLSWEANKKLKSEIAKGDDIVLLKPMTFMNNSGVAAALAMNYYKLLPKKFALLTARNSDLSPTLTVINDDIDIALGKYKLSVDSRSAGHRGVESIIAHLKTKNFRRWRIGIMGDKPDRMPARNYVLAKFTAGELETIKSAISRMVQEQNL